MSANILLMDSQQKAILSHLMSLDAKCPCCSKQDFNIENILQEIRNFNAMPNIIDANRSAVVTIVCRKCGYMMLFSANYLGITPGNNPNLKVIL